MRGTWHRLCYLSVRTSDMRAKHRHILPVSAYGIYSRYTVRLPWYSTTDELIQPTRSPVLAYIA